MRVKNKRKLIISVFTAVVLMAALIGVYSNRTKGVFASNSRKLPIYSVQTDEKKVAITFDASWGEDKTDKIIEVLDKYNVKATFFVVGAWVDQHPDKLKELYEKGHEIGNHSNMHPIMTKSSKEKIINDICIADAKIMKITGEKPKLFRFPDGAYNDASITAVESTNHTCVQWDVDSIDWKAEGADIEYRRIVDKTKPGSILLFHNDGKYTPENLPKIIEKLEADGYKFVKISELIYKENYYLDHEGKQIKIKKENND